MSSLRNKLKKLSFFTHYPKNHESLTINNVTEEYDSKEEMWNEWFGYYYFNGKWYLNEPVTILKFTGTNFVSDNSVHGDFSDSIVYWGDGEIESPSQLTHTYTNNSTYTIEIVSAPISSNNCFKGCTGLKDITIPDNITSIGGGCFSQCTGLTKITIPDNITSIGTACFYECSNLTNVVLPNTITSIEMYCFKRCTSLTRVNLNWTTSNTIVTYNSNWIEDANANLKFIIPKETTSLYTSKGYPSSKLQEVT